MGVDYLGAVIQLPDFALGPPISISASSFVKYRQCPQKGLAHHRGIYGDQSRAGWIGQLVHRLIARDLRDGGLENIEQAAREEIGSTHLNYDQNMSVGKPSDIRRAIAEALESFNDFRQLPRPSLDHVEVSITVDAGSEVTLKGIIDGVESVPEGIRLIDWKSGPVRPEAEIQLRFYALLWLLGKGQMPVVAEAVSIRTGERAGYEVGIESLQDLVGDIDELVTSVRHALADGSDLVLQSGPWCRHCPILDDCDEGQTAVSILSK